MIGRLWRGWTTPENADPYETLLRTVIFPGILGRSITGFRRIELHRRTDGDSVEFLTFMWFDSLGDVVAFAGEDYETAVVPQAAQALLSRYDRTSAHYDLREARDSAP